MVTGGQYQYGKGGVTLAIFFQPLEIDATMVARTFNRERLVGCPYRWKTVAWLYNDITRDGYNNLCPLAEK